VSTANCIYISGLIGAGCELIPSKGAVPILIIFEGRRFVYPPDYDVMQYSGYIKTGLFWRDQILVK
jgi:hypothetical protein